MVEPSDSQAKWYAMTSEDVAAQLNVDPAKGLSASEAQQRLQQYGPNVLAAKKKESGLHAFLRQYQEFMQWILLGATILSLVVTRELGTTLALVGLTIFNAVLGLRGESKAEASLEALKKMMKNIAACAATARPSRSRPKGWCRATSCSWRRATACRPMGVSSSPPPWRSRKRP